MVTGTQIVYYVVVKYGYLACKLLFCWKIIMPQANLSSVYCRLMVYSRHLNCDITALIIMTFVGCSGKVYERSF